MILTTVRTDASGRRNSLSVPLYSTQTFRPNELNERPWYEVEIAGEKESRVKGRKRRHSMHDPSLVRDNFTTPEMSPKRKGRLMRPLNEISMEMFQAEIFSISFWITLFPTDRKLSKKKKHGQLEIL